MSAKPSPALLNDMVSGCLMNRARLVARVVTGIYEDELRPFGIKGSQLNLLAGIAAMGALRRSDLARAMHIDISTLTRNLRIMQTNGWIAEARDATDGRGAPLRVTEAGERLLAEVAPAWRVAQRRAGHLLGSEGRASLVGLSDAVWTA